MAFTSMPGTPGLVSPGYHGTGIAVWRGPFPSSEAVINGTPIRVIGQTTVPLATASQMAASDPTWWEFH